MKIIKDNIKIGSTLGNRTIANATNLFYYIDKDFKNWDLDISEKSTKEETLSIYETEEDSTFEKMFSDVSKDIDSLVLTQEQILSYIENNKNSFGEPYILFLFKVRKEFFVARVSVGDGGQLEVYVFLFSYDYVVVWRAERRFRIVVPQLNSLKPSPSNLDSLTLESALKLVIDSGYKVSK